MSRAVDLRISAPGSSEHRGRCSFQVDEILAARSSALSFEREVSLDVWFLAAFMALLRRYTGGSVIAAEALIDRGTRTLAVQVDFRGDPTFADLLEQIEGEGGALGRPELSAGLDFGLELRSADAGLCGEVLYDGGRDERTAALRLAEHFLRLIGGIEGSKRISELPLLTAAELHQVTVEWNDTSLNLRGELLFHRLFERQAERTPDGAAVRFGGETWSYRELDRRANRLAHLLRRLGVRPEERVALFLNRSAEVVAAILAVLKAGGAYVPLDPAYPDERLGLMLHDSGPRLVITCRALAGQLPPGMACVLLDGDGEAIAAESDEVPASEAVADNLAYVIYTSGSTGAPKGVLVPHRGLINMAWMQRRVFGLAPGARVLQLFSFSFDASMWDLLLAFGSGATLCVAPEEARLPGPALEKLLREERVNVVTLPPSLLAALPAEEFPDIHSVMTTGESCTPLIVELWAPGRLFVNGYGPTETTIGSTLAACSVGDRITIGRSFENSRVYLLDEDLSPVPPGVMGEIWIGGIGVVRGYLHHPELTALRFVPDLLGQEPGARMYRTGDLARYLPDGHLEFAGRADHQVKVRGFRVEPGEIEAQLVTCPDVREAVVVVREGPSGAGRLVAYVAGRNGAAPEASRLREVLSSRLPPYMVPSVFVVLDALPRTSRGKLDRDALPAPEDLRPGSEASAMPRTATEQVMAGLWQDLFRCEHIGVDDDFLSLGGHSLLATRLASRIHGAFQVEVPTRTILESPTVAVLSRWVDETLRTSAASAALPLVRAPREADLPLSYSQQRMWLSSQIDGAGGAWNIPMRFHVAGPLDVAALGRAFTEVVRRHEILRTVYRWAGMQPVQEVEPVPDLVLPVVDLICLGEDDRASELRRIDAEEARRVFDFRRAPLLRIGLLRAGSEVQVLLVTLHHLVMDAWSAGILLEEIKTLYEAFLAGRPSPLPELPLQYADFACSQRRWIEEGALDEQRAFWRQNLASPPGLLSLPVDHPRPPVPSVREGAGAWPLSSSRMRALQDLGNRRGATLFMTFLAVLDVLLYRLTGQTDLVVGTDIANRTHPETEQLIGFFVNVLALRTQLSPGLTFLELLDRVRETALAAYAHQELPYEEVLGELGVDGARAPLFNVFFLIENATAGSLELPGAAVTSIRASSGIALRDLSIYALEGPDGWSIAWSYKADLFEPRTIERFAHQLQALIESVTARPEARLDELDLATETEKRREAREQEERQVRTLASFKKFNPRPVDLGDEGTAPEPRGDAAQPC